MIFISLLFAIMGALVCFIATSSIVQRRRMSYALSVAGTTSLCLGSLYFLIALVGILSYL